MASHAQDYMDMAQAREACLLADGGVTFVALRVPAERAGRPAVSPGLSPLHTPGSALGSLASVALSSEPARAFYPVQQRVATSPLVPRNAINASVYAF
jgi:hypothetical protein